jgi:Kef-type K+ transport system membrane component KefB
LFFASVGLGLRLGGFDGRMVLLTLAILGCGVFGKALGAVLPARLLGFGWRDSTGLGVMMNCRGLTELVVLNIGRSLHLISEPMFVAFLVLTLVTTAATGPLLTLVIGLGQRRGALSGRSDVPATPAVPG